MTNAVSSSQNPVPLHIGVIMDGNGRWAAARGLPRIEGHRRGIEAVRSLVKAAEKHGIRYLTLYSFSKENWTRPAGEVSELMGLLKFFIEKDLQRLKKDGVKIRILGDKDSLTKDIAGLLRKAEAETEQNERLYLQVAFNYGSRDEITRAARNLALDVTSGTINADAISEEAFSTYLDTKDIPDPDLILRTSGEIRLSNFLLWQAAYAEFVFLDVLWPDFGESHLSEALSIYAKRDRRYGGVTPDSSRLSLQKSG